MNRAQRRAAAKGVPSYKRGRTTAELLNAMAKNGITAADYKKAYEDGYKQGVEDAGRMGCRSIYAAILIVLHEEHGFGKKRLINVLRKIDEKVQTCLAHLELIDEAFEKTGVELDFDQPIDRVAEKE